MPQQRLDILAAALALHDAGCSVVPIALDGTKRPSIPWKQYQTGRADRDTVTTWFAEGHQGLGVITGSASGNLELLELEGRAVAEGKLRDLAEMAMSSGLADLWRRVTAEGYMTRSPAGGLHLLYRVLGPVAGNTKLARRKNENGVEVLAETRGEGGLVVVAPSHGPVHPTGAPWVQAAGGPHTIPDLTPADRDALHALASTLDRMPTPEPPTARRPSASAPASPADAFLLGVGRGPDGGLSPGDDYNARADWADILQPHGWRLTRTRGTERFWLRPGKEPASRDDTSATTGYGDRGDWLWVFSTSTEFDTETTYSKFAAYALLEHGGDYSAAARALRSQGYGTTPQLQAGSAPVSVPSSEVPRPDEASTRDTVTVTSHAGLTDVGNADLLVQRHGHELRYVPERGAWLRWGGTHWSWDEAGRVVEAAKATALAINTSDDELRNHRTRSLSRRAIEAMVALARTHPQVVAPAALLDADPYALCTPDGVIDLHTGLVTPSDPAGLHTRCTTVSMTAGPTPRWDTFLADTFGDDDEMRGFVQRLAGHSATGIVTHHVLPFLHGSGGNGKSVFLDVIRRLLGDYAASAPAGFLLAGQLQHETEVARLAGLRMVICSEGSVYDYRTADTTTEETA